MALFERRPGVAAGHPARREGAQLAQFLDQRLDRIGARGRAAARRGCRRCARRRRSGCAGASMNCSSPWTRAGWSRNWFAVAQKSDVDEELDRLDAHVAEVRRVLAKGGPCGRRLDFLMQEFNREANTLSSKATTGSTTQSAVELKVLIEQMREQVQNIE
jgi:uncharacterized protein (TIGR00255 family)